jgi:outer membrane receptor protein involved in Fe transport
MLNLKLVLLAGVGAIAIAGPAFAQDAEAGPQSPEAAAEAPVQDIVVTGSRIVTNGNSQPTPVTVATTDVVLRTSPTSIPDALNKLPAFAVSRGSSIQANISDNFNGNFLNLRGLGIDRNLVLLDGRRVAPTSFSGAVDTNVLPQMLVQRVEIVTGGASAVYGSDAVSGVINYIIDRKFKGLKVEASSGIASRGDAPSWRAAAAFGTDFLGGRGHFMASYEHFDQNGITKESRPAGAAIYAVAGAGTAANPYRLISDARSSSFDFGGLIGSGPLNGQVFVAPGVAGPPVRGTAQGGILFSGGDGGYAKHSSATGDTTTDQAFARVDFDATDNVHLIVQGNYSRSNNLSYLFPTFTGAITVGSDNAFLSPATRAAIGAPSFTFSKLIDGDAYRMSLDATTESWSVLGGIEADLAGLKWNASFQHGQSTTTLAGAAGFVNNGRLRAALDAVDQGQFLTGVADGNIVCRATLTNPNAYPGCIPYNAFGAPSSTQAASINWFMGNLVNKPKFVMDSAQFGVSGSAFEGWAGPVGFAITGEWRKVSLDVSSNLPASLVTDCTGIRFSCTTGVTPYLRTGQILPISRSNTVKEIAGEVNFPLLRESAVGDAALNGAIRYTDYSTSGGVTTYKIGGDWKPLDGVRVRAAYSRDIRAPSLWELYQPATDATSGFQDSHTPFNGVVLTRTSGNANLTPEIAKTLTVGLVVSPPSVPGLNFAVDYYRINMSNAITQVDGRSATVQNLCEASNGAGIFCALYDRPLEFSDRTSANAPTLVRVQRLNAASVKTRGIDAEAGYAFAVGDDQRVSLRLLASYQPKFTQTLIPGTAPQILAGTAAIQGTGGVPKLRMTGFVNYSTPDFAIDLQERWRSSLNWDSNPALVYAIPKIAAVAYTDVTLTFYPGQDQSKQIYFSVQNLFDKQSPVYAIPGMSATPNFQYPVNTGDDVLGRYLTVGARFRF